MRSTFMPSLRVVHRDALWYSIRHVRGRLIALNVLVIIYRSEELERLQGEQAILDPIKAKLKSHPSIIYW